MNRASLLLFLFISAACQGGTSTERFNAFPSPALSGGAAFCTAWSVAECQRLQRCDVVEHAGRERSGGCAAVTEALCQATHARWLAAESMGHAVLRARHAQVCVSRTAAVACGEREPSICSEAWSGLLALDARCEAHEQCVPGLRCSSPCGRCSSQGSFACVEDAECLQGDRCVDNACTLALLTGERCDDAPTSCAEGLLCVGIPGLMACAPPVAEGASCAGELCGDGLACAGNVCRRLAEEGEACGDVPCRDEGRRLWCNAGTCAVVAVVMTGDACDDRRVCSAADGCVAGTCVARPRAGEPCSAEGDCFLSRCVEGTCVARSRAGDACTDFCDGLSCANGRCGLACTWTPMPDAGVLP